MKLLEDLGKRKVGKRSRRYGLFYCDVCCSKVERRIDVGMVQASCGCTTDYKGVKETQVCNVCNIAKPLDSFYKRIDSVSGYRNDCKECCKARTLRNKFGVDYKWYINKLKEQDSKCAICGHDIYDYMLFHKKNERFAIDHCHTTGKIRGLLCTKCNTGIGLFNDNIEILQKAKEYIIKYI